MTPRWIDTHCHITFSGYEANRDQVIARLRAQSTWGITIGTTTETSRQAVAFAETQDGIWATVGHHPEHFTTSHEFADEPDAHHYQPDELERLAQSSKKVVAIGETGLDFFRIDADRDPREARLRQEEAFREQIAIAKRCHLPVVIHCRDALTRLAEIIEEEKRNGWDARAVVHCFTGTWSDAQPLLDLGLSLSFTGIITFPLKKDTDHESHMHRVIERIPLERLMIETDAPFLTPIPHRGKQNEPSYVHFIGEKIAELRVMSIEEISQTTTANAIEFFGLY